MRAVPQRQQRAHAGAGDVDGAREQRVVDRCAARELGPFHLDVHALLLAVLLDQLLVTRHVQQQVDHAELLGNAQAALGVRHAGQGEAGALPNQHGQHGGGGAAFQGGRKE
ncbi:hypothetical protein D3C86_1685150 [compost metagenome]